MSMEEKTAQYQALCHQVQTGVATKMGFDESEASAKHLRVGVNMAMIEHGALVGLLVEKGIIEAEEYVDALIKTLEAEVIRYRTEIAEFYGVPVDNIHLG